MVAGANGLMKTNRVNFTMKKKSQSKMGYVYILTNPSFRDDWVKIGKTERPVDVRSKELDNTAVPLPFEKYATLKTVKYAKAEKLIHKMIDRLTDKRIRKNREFFNIEPQQALDILNDVSELVDGEVVVWNRSAKAEVVGLEEVVKPNSAKAKAGKKANDGREVCGVPFKVSDVVRALFPVVFDQKKKLITKAEVSFLLSKDSSAKFRTGGWPVLKPDTGKVSDRIVKSSNGSSYVRYYGSDRISLKFRGKKYLLTSQFMPAALERVVEWLEDKGIAKKQINQLVKKALA